MRLWFMKYLICLAGIGLGAEAAEHAKSAAPIVLDVLEPADQQKRVVPLKDFPVNVGLVFPEGELSGVSGGSLKEQPAKAGETAKPVPFEAEATGWWNPEKSNIKWLLLKFNASADKKYIFTPGAAPVLADGPALAEEKDGIVTVSTNAITVKIRKNGGALFENVSLNDGNRKTPMLQPLGAPESIVVDDGEKPIQTKLDGWQIDLEEGNTLRATVRGRGFFVDPQGAKVAALDVRCQFFKDESFARVYHTLTWMVRDRKRGVRGLSVGLKPLIGGTGTLKLGVSETGGNIMNVPWTSTSSLYAHQDSADHFLVDVDGKPVREGLRLGGWMSMEDAEGRGVAVCVRDFWQTYPAAFAVREGELQVQLWPDKGRRMGFDYADIMPEPFYSAPEWKRYDWSKAEGVCKSEYEGNPGFVFTAEGAARTHEMLVHFYNKQSARGVAELNGLTQQPVVVRQDPTSAMRVPFMGFDLTAVNDKDFPDMERAIDTLGRLATARWGETHDYGFWRFGMMRWYKPNEGLYRWFDGVQYDQQLIPWMLFLRGGGRHFYEEGERTARFGMDVATNHFNTRQSAPGYQATAACLPFPMFSGHLHKGTKIHFLQYYYHVTGYKRAKEVMDEVIAGAKNQAMATPRAKKEEPVYAVNRGHARELFNMNTLWCNAYEETFDPQIKEFAREWIDLTIDREYRKDLRLFRSPAAYLFTGLVIQNRLWKDPRIEETVLEALDNAGYPGLPDGGVWWEEGSVACQLAFEKTGDKRYASVAWDIARTLADVVPLCDPKNPPPPNVSIQGDVYYRTYLLPMLVGLSLAQRARLKNDHPPQSRDVCVALLSQDPQEPLKSRMYLRPGKDGKLELRLLVRQRWGGEFKPVSVVAMGGDGRELGKTVIDGKCSEETPSTKERFWPLTFHACRQDLTLADVKKDELVTLVFEKDKDTERQIYATVVADAAVAFHVPAKAHCALGHNADQYYAGACLYGRTTQEVIRIGNLSGNPYAIRDARTWELLYQSPLPVVLGEVSHRVGANRAIAIVVRGFSDTLSFNEGLSPYFSTTAEGWFEPEDKKLGMRHEK